MDAQGWACATSPKNRIFAVGPIDGGTMIILSAMEDSAGQLLGVGMTVIAVN